MNVSIYFQANLRILKREVQPKERKSTRDKWRTRLQEIVSIAVEFFYSHFQNQKEILNLIESDIGHRRK